MNIVGVLFKKEVMESIRKYRVFVMLTIFLIIGIISPIGTRYLGEILQQLLPDGYTIEFRSASEVESYFQFFKNISQLGLIVLIFMTCGLMSDELESKTIVNVLSKGVKRSHVIISKFLATTVLWILSYLLSFAAFWYYTGLFFGNAIDSGIVLYSNFIICEYGVLIISINILLGIVFKNKILTVVVAFIINIMQMFLGVFPQITKLLPASILSQCVYIVEGEVKISETIITSGITFVCIIFVLIISVIVFNKKEIEQ